MPSANTATAGRGNGRGSRELVPVLPDVHRSVQIVPGFAKIEVRLERLASRLVRPFAVQKRLRGSKLWGVFAFRARPCETLVPVYPVPGLFCAVVA